MIANCIWERINEEIYALKEERTKLAVALQACVRWMRDDDHVLEQFEDIGDWFYHDTGMLRPGKDDGSFTNRHERQVAWDKWCEKTQKRVRAEAQRVLQESEQFQSQGTEHKAPHITFNCGVEGWNK